MPARTHNSPLETLPAVVPKVFDQAQVSTANHQKNFVALHKLQADAATITEPVRNGKSVKLVGERAFEDAFLDMVTRVLPVKKGVGQADRVAKFIGGYTKFINEKALERKSEDDDDDDTTASRFVARLLKFLLNGFLAKDKAVRYRAVHVVAEMVSHLGEIDEEVYSLLRASLLERVHDKESPIRVQAVIGLSKLSGSEDPADLEDGEPTVTDVLQDTLASDPAPDVRRAALLNVPPSPSTLSSILERTRDTDTTLRRLVYTAVLEPNALLQNAIGPTHPRALTIAQRELIVRNGLGDREASVRAAAGALMGTWVDVVGNGGGEKKVLDDVVALLKMFDLAESIVAEDVLLSVFATRVDIFDNLEFGEDFWSELTPETAFLARVFVEHCIAIKDEARLEGVLPVVTALAFRIQSSYNDLLDDMQADEHDLVDEHDNAARARREEREEKKIDTEFIIGEMLKLAVNLDYADEIGRRKMFQLVRDMISQDALPESLLAKCLDVLRKLSPNERDLIRVVVEVVHELRDSSDPEEDTREQSTAEDEESNAPESVMPAPASKASRGSTKPESEMTPEEKARADNVDLRCLSLCIGMLERVNGTFEENSTLEGILGELIIPAVKRKELALREKGLRMALNSFQLFLSQVQAAPEVLKLRVLQIVFDILMVHEGEFLGKEGAAGDRIVEFLLHVLNNEESDKVSALLCIGIAKLVLSGMISDERVLKSLVWSYVSPDTAENQELRQCLSYFFPVYCYSSPVNQRRMQQIFVPMFQRLAQEYRELDEEQDMVSPALVGAMFVDWTDPQKAVDVQGQSADDTIQIDMASDIIKALFSKDIQRESCPGAYGARAEDDKKVLCQLLGKLYIPDTLDDDKLRTLKLLMDNLRSRRPLRDTTANNAFTRFDAAITKKFEAQLEGFSEEEYRKLEHLKDLFEFLDDIIPEDDEEEVEVPKKRGARKRRSESIVSTASSTNGGTPPPSSRRRGATKNKSKRRRLSTSDDESDDDSTEMGTPPPSSLAPTRSLPKRAAAAKKKSIVDVPSSDEDDDDEDNDATPAPPSHRRRKLVFLNPIVPISQANIATISDSGETQSTEGVDWDAEIDDLVGHPSPADSIIDDEEEEEEEVNKSLIFD
ncbi:hypothetical protein PLICRDRAFT_30295 [Plicaturopsis crispa FD-325 SS-3]|nr:hypothetical protein PLICRDRAFT_30295 [Plicaturopsis crispa FD-325 SS-3]